MKLKFRRRVQLHLAWVFRARTPIEEERQISMKLGLYLPLAGMRTLLSGLVTALRRQKIMRWQAPPDLRRWPSRRHRCQTCRSRTGTRAVGCCRREEQRVGDFLRRKQCEHEGIEAAEGVVHVSCEGSLGALGPEEAVAAADARGWQTLVRDVSLKMEMVERCEEDVSMLRFETRSD